MAFAFTEQKYQQLLARVTALEHHSNDLSIAQDNFITLEQVNQLMVVLQSDLDVLLSQVAALESRVTSLEEEPLS